MKNRKFFISLLLTIGITLIVCLVFSFALSKLPLQVAGNTATLQTVSQTIAASGSIHSQQEVTLHFPTAGKLTYLPFKQGDSVLQGQTIASLDTYALQKQLQIQANAYQIAKNGNDQVQENNQASVLEGQQRVAFDTTNNNSYSAITEAQLITDTVQRLVDNSLLSQNTAQLQVDLANYALQLASLQAPFSGIITSEDVTTPNVNVTTTTGFSLADPTENVFRAQVAASDIDFVSVGGVATITLDGQKKSLTGTVLTIYPQKQTLSSGEDVYLVDISAAGLQKTAFGQNGSVLITSNVQAESRMVPLWAIVGHTSVWVWDNNHAVLKTVQLGQTHNQMIEVQSGLLPTDKIITSPQVLIQNQYPIL